jgi:hypothetical protein
MSKRKLVLRHVQKGTKRPVCSKCRKPLPGRVPLDARQITCFKCDQTSGRFSQR